MSQKVSFTAMEHGSQEDYDLIMADEESKAGHLADRVLDWLRAEFPDMLVYSNMNFSPS